MIHDPSSISYASEISQLKEVVGRCSKNVNLSRTSPIPHGLPRDPRGSLR